MLFWGHSPSHGKMLLDSSPHYKQHHRIVTSEEVASRTCGSLIAPVVYSAFAPRYYMVNGTCLDGAWIKTWTSPTVATGLIQDEPMPRGSADDVAQLHPLRDVQSWRTTVDLFVQFLVGHYSMLSRMTPCNITTYHLYNSLYPAPYAVSVLRGCS